jgi:hypothetical protein
VLRAALQVAPAARALDPAARGVVVAIRAPRGRAARAARPGMDPGSRRERLADRVPGFGASIDGA